jgi:hypothetical protein
VLRYDTVLDQLTLYARTEISDRINEPAHPALLHFRGKLYVGGDSGTLEIHRAARNDTSSFAPETVALGGPLRGLAADRAYGVVYAATDSALYRSTLALEPAQFTPVGPLNDAVAITHSGHYGGASTMGLFVLDQGGSRVLRVPDLQAIGLQAFAPETYLIPEDDWHDLDATACGRLLAAGDAGAWIAADDTDPRLGFETWVADEFAQVVSFCKGLISPDGEPARLGDRRRRGPRLGSVPPGEPRRSRVGRAGAADERPPHRRSRGAGVGEDGARGATPVSPATASLRCGRPTGSTCTGWTRGRGSPRRAGSTSYATLSTMKIVLAADRARRYYWDDPSIVAAADAITGGVSNWSAYIQPVRTRSTSSAHPGAGRAAGRPVGSTRASSSSSRRRCTTGRPRRSIAGWTARPGPPPRS